MIKQPAVWPALPGTAPGCCHKIMRKQQVWRPINLSPKSESCSKDPFVRQKTATPYGLNCFPNGQIRAGPEPRGTREKRADARHARRNPVSAQVSSKMADMILHENSCDRNRRVAAKRRACLRAGSAVETAAPIRAALTDARLGFLAFRGSRLAKPSTGFAQ